MSSRQPGFLVAAARVFLRCTLVAALLTPFVGCASSGLEGNEEGSQPLNHTEEVQYKQALLRCLKMGGSRVVKIEGQLQCF